VTLHNHLLPARAAQHNASTLRLSDFGSSFATRIAAWIATATDYFNAAVLYEQLSGLSDAELHRLGFSRASLGRDIAQACDRASA